MINGDEDTFVFKHYPRLNQMNACPGTGNTRVFIRISTNILQSADKLGPPCLFEVAVQDLFSEKHKYQKYYMKGFTSQISPPITIKWGAKQIKNK